MFQAVLRVLEIAIVCGAAVTVVALVVSRNKEK